MRNRYRPWNCAQNNQLTNSTEEEATWPSTLRRRKRLVAPGLGTDDGEEKRAGVGVSLVRLVVHGSHASAQKKAWEPLMPVLTSLWLLTRTLAFQRPHSQRRFATGRREEAFWTFLAALYSDLWPCLFKRNIRAQTHTAHACFPCLFLRTHVSASWCLLSPPAGPGPGWAG